MYIGFLGMEPCMSGRLLDFIELMVFLEINF